MTLGALVGLGLTRTAYDGPARAVLHREALLLARLVDSPAGAPGRPLRAALRSSRIRVVRVGPDGTVPSASLLGGSDPAAARLRAAAAAASSTQQTVTLSGQRYLTDTEPVAAGGGVVLLERLADVRAVNNRTARDIGWAAALGLVVAVSVGVALSRRLTRPLVRAAGAARQLAAGRRDVRLGTDGPTEVAAVSASLNTVAETLARAEARQRDFLLSVSHELRTPLTAIRGFSEAIADRVAVGEEAVDAGRTIVEEATRMAGLVSDLLELARSGTSDFRISVADVDLGALLATTLQAWRERAGARGIALRLEMPPEPVHVRTDAFRVRQIVDALTDNAVRAAPPGSVVVLALRRAAGAAGVPATGQPPVPPAGLPPGALLEVRDSGPGLAPADYAVAFEPGLLHERYRGVREVGSGVGLALVGSLAQRLGGQAMAGPAPEGGAAFAVVLPADPARTSGRDG